ncbi:rhombosortase [Vibrio sp. SCSIO 43136]|uniref:rhombosortase n=1 Tax=Vibrio sp. SCSIO 43136 TaxID=2819101 RepID=UPI0020759647|nr:rhombosortase [Vibrio sp. SCSIO 43136]USD64467.1 rhombosortase [Vibrio sp. SCSIO 43136]
MLPSLIITSLIMVLAQLPALHPLLNWDASLIQQGQYWRILTAHFTHTNWTHLAMNCAGLWVICWFFRDSWSTKRFWMALTVISLLVSMTLPLTNTQWYAGLSAVLHGLFALFAVIEIINGRHTSVWLLVGLTVKIGWENLAGPSHSTEAMINARVAVEAHLAGAIAGLLLGLTIYLRKRLDIK